MTTQSLAGLANALITENGPYVSHSVSPLLCSFYPPLNMSFYYPSLFSHCRGHHQHGPKHRQDPYFSMHAGAMAGSWHSFCCLLGSYGSSGHALTWATTPKHSRAHRLSRLCLEPRFRLRPATTSVFVSFLVIPECASRIG